MSVGQRLKEERERIGLNQTAFGAIGGVQKQAQLKYEADTSSPSAKYLAEVAKIGVDTQYIITGVRISEVLGGQSISDDEKQLLSFYRNASPDVQRFLMASITASKHDSRSTGNAQVTIGNNNKVTAHFGKKI